jgi:hypothetical protein
MARAAQDVVGALAHQHVVAGDPGLALGTVEDQGLDRSSAACRA